MSDSAGIPYGDTLDAARTAAAEDNQSDFQSVLQERRRASYMYHEANVSPLSSEGYQATLASKRLPIFYSDMSPEDQEAAMAYLLETNPFYLPAEYIERMTQPSSTDLESLYSNLRGKDQAFYLSDDLVAGDDPFTDVGATEPPNDFAVSIEGNRLIFSVGEQEFSFTTTLSPQNDGNFEPTNNTPFGVTRDGMVLESPLPSSEIDWKLNTVSGKSVRSRGGGTTRPEDGSITASSPRLSLEPSKIEFVGWAADGAPILYSEAVESSWQNSADSAESANENWRFVEGSGDLDPANGAFLQNGSYVYFLTPDNPNVPSYFAGNPDPSFG